MDTVLIVARGERSRHRIGAWLEGAGFDVMICPGPTEPDGCILLSGTGCPLASEADVIVVDAGEGGPELPALVQAYADRGHAVVVLGSIEGAISDPVVRATRFRRAVVRAVRRAVRAGRSAAESA